MIKTCQYYWPDNKTITAYAWTNDWDRQRYIIDAKKIKGVYPELPIFQAVHVYAVTRFTVFHDVCYAPGYWTCRNIQRRRSR